MPKLMLKIGKLWLLLILLTGCTMLWDDGKDGVEIGGKTVTPTNIRLFGEETLGKKYIGIGQKILGALKQQMDLGGHKNLGMNKTLPDGTKIHVQSNMWGIADIDEIWIDVISTTSISSPSYKSIGYILSSIRKTNGHDYNSFNVFLPDGSPALPTGGVGEPIQGLQSEGYFKGFPDNGAFYSRGTGIKSQQIFSNHFLNTGSNEANTFEGYKDNFVYNGNNGTLPPVPDGIPCGFMRKSVDNRSAIIEQAGYYVDGGMFILTDMGDPLNVNNVAATAFMIPSGTKKRFGYSPLIKQRKNHSYNYTIVGKPDGLAVEDGAYDFGVPVSVDSGIHKIKIFYSFSDTVSNNFNVQVLMESLSDGGLFYVSTDIDAGAILKPSGSLNNYKGFISVEVGAIVTTLPESSKLVKYTIESSI